MADGNTKYSRVLTPFLRNHRAVISRLRMLRRYRGDPAKPNIMHLAVTDKCNMSCPFCLYKKDNKNFRVLDAARACSMIDEIDTPIILLSGGEPLLGGEVLDTTRAITHHCRDAGRITGVLTNGITLKKVIMRDYPEFKPGSKFFFQISIDGLGKDHDKLRGHFDLIIGNIRFAKEAGHLIYTNTVVSKSNIGSLDRIVEFISGFGDRIYLNPMVTHENALDEEGLKYLGQYIAGHQDIRIGNSINYGKFLMGGRNLKCMFHSLVSVTPTGRIKFPCYCFGDGAEYMDSFSDYLKKVDELRSYYEGRRAPQCFHCHTHCLHEADVYAHYYLDEILEQGKRPAALYKKYLAPFIKSFV